jgi:hypothetical protein
MYFVMLCCGSVLCCAVLCCVVFMLSLIIYRTHSTCHVTHPCPPSPQDDLSRNFAMNPENGITCRAFYRDGSKKKKKSSSGSGSSARASSSEGGVALLPSAAQDNELVLLTR